MTFWKWSQIASTNGTADSTCPFPEGMAPSAVNDGVRGAMAALAKYRDDIGGLTATAGSSTAYTYLSYQGFDSLAHMNGAMIAFVPHANNGAAPTLNVDGLGARGLRASPGVDIPAATLIQGTPYVATYDNSVSVWYLHGLYGNPYNIPLLGGIDYWGTTAPNSSFVFPVGQPVSRTTYAAAFAIMGTTFGAGDGSSTFNLPDKRGRVSAAWDAMGGGGAGRFSPAFGGSTGTENTTLAMGNLPASPVSVSGTTSSWQPTINSGTTTAVATGVGSAVTNINLGSGAQVFGSDKFNVLDAVPARTVSGTTANLGSSTPFSTAQPTIVCNYIMRII